MADPKVADGLYKIPGSGARVHVRGGQVLLKDVQGRVTRVSPAEAPGLISGAGFTPAAPSDVVAEAEAKRAASRTLGEEVLTAAERVPSGIYGGATAVPRALGGFAEGLIRDTGGTGRVPNLSGPSVSELSEEGVTKAVARAVTGSKQEGERYIAERAQRAKDSPIAATIGETAGQTLGAVAAPGLGSSLGAVDAARGARIAGSALEGAGFGGSAALEDAYIQDKPLTGESMLAAMGPMALLGAGLGAGAEGISALRARGTAHATSGADAAESSLLGAAPKSGSKAADALRKFSDERTMKALGFRGSDIRRLGRTGEAVEERIARMGEDIHNYRLKDGRKVFEPLQSGDELLERLRTAEAESTETLSGFRKRIYEAERRDPTLGVGVEELAAKIEADVAGPLRSSGVRQLQMRGQRVMRAVQEIRDVAAGEGGLEALARYRRDLADSGIYPKSPGPGVPPLPSANPAAQDLIKVERMLEDAIEQATDRIAAGLPEAERYTDIKSTWRSMRTAREALEKGELQDLGNRVVSPSDYIVGTAGAIASGNPLGGIVSAIVHKGVREHSSAVLAVTARRLADAIDQRAAKAVNAMAHVPSTAAATAAEPAASAMLGRRTIEAAMTRPEYARRILQLQFASSDENRVSQLGKGLGPLYAHAPQSAMHANDAANRAVEYLTSKVPETPAVTLSPLYPRPDPTAPDASSVSDEELHAFGTVWRAVEDPMSVLEDAANGTLTPEAVEAVKYVYPTVYARMQAATLRALAALKEPPPYNARLMLDMLLSLDGQGEPSMAPGFQATLSQVGAAQAQQEAQQGSKPRRPPLKGPKNGTATVGQAVEGLGA